jgi:hypothetical protein
VPKPIHIMCDLVKKYNEKIINENDNPLFFIDNIGPFFVFCKYTGKIEIGGILVELEKIIVRNQIIEAYKCRISFPKIAKLFSLQHEGKFNFYWMTKKQIEKKYNINFKDIKKYILLT